ncbi:uncharacterized protein [Melopsittacus undulatus]|uniref:uncharacterized protein n=1 Tax=Melopsittacus undulatus TaxID=13146 RepID=UPI00146B1DC3|nr:uncharacterized protein LOC117438351 [Melopsittacus undulatus]
MPVGKEANARSQPAEGRPSKQRRRQVAHRQPEEAPQGSPRQASSHHGITLPRVPYLERFQPVVTQQAQMGSLGHRVVLPSLSGLRQEQMLQLPPLVTMAPRPPPRSERAVGSCRRLSPVTPAASAASGRVRNSAVGSASSNQEQLLKTAAQLHRVPSYGSRGARPETCQPALHRSKASAPTGESSGSMSTVLQRCSTGSQRRHQQPVARQEPAQSRAAGTQARADTVRAASSSKGPATQPTLRSSRRAAEQLPAIPAEHITTCINTEIPSVHYRPVAQRLPSLPSKIKPLEPPKRSCLVRAPEKEEHQARLTPMPRAWASNNAVQKEAAPQRQRHGPALQNTKVPDAVLQVTTTSEKMKPLLLPVAMVQRTNKKQVEQQGISQKLHVEMAELSQAALKDNEFPVAAETRGEAAGDLESVCPVLAGATDTELAAPPLAGAAEEEQHPAPLTSVEQEQEEAPEAPSHGFDKEEQMRLERTQCRPCLPTKKKPGEPLSL